MQFLLLALVISFTQSYFDAPKILTTCPQTIPAPYAKERRAKKGTLIIVYKSMFRLGLYKNGKLISIHNNHACFAIAMGRTPWNRKIKRDYSSTPEGWYHVAAKRDIGQTTFYRGFVVSYPNNNDVMDALSGGIISESTAHQQLRRIERGQLPSQSTNMGGLILVHGMGSEYPFWTAGCVALENEAMDILFPFIHRGDDILIIPWSEKVYMIKGYVHVFKQKKQQDHFLIPVDPTPQNVFTPETSDFIEVNIQQ